MKQRHRSTIVPNIQWLRKKYPKDTHDFAITGALSTLLHLFTVIAASFMPALVIYLLSTRQFILIFWLVGFSSAIGLCHWLYGQLHTRLLWRTISLRMALSALDARIFLHLPYLQQTDPAVQQQRANSAHLGFDEDDMGITPFVLNLINSIETVTILIFIVAITLKITWWISVLIAITILFTLLLLRHFDIYRSGQLSKLDKLYFKQKYFFETAYDTDANEDIRLYHYDTFIKSHIDAIQTDILTAENQIRHRQQIISILVTIISVLRMSIVYGTLLIQTTQNIQSINSFVFFFSILTTVEALVAESTNNFSALLSAAHDVSIGRLFIDSAPISCEKPTHADSPVSSPIKIRFDHVSFKYPNQTSTIIDDVSFEIHEGENIALVGLNGAGKTTLTLLLMGYLQPTTGEIYFNGTAASSLCSSDQLKLFSSMFQENVVLAASVSDNITFSQHPNQPSLHDAIVASDLFGRVAGLPQAADTQLTQYIDNDGVNLSGGETEKLMLARMIYRHAPIIILDEPTAALDALAESNLYDQIRRITSNATSLFISHRLASTKFANRIFFMKQGKIVDIGTHETLLERNDEYRTLYDSQRRYYTKAGEQHA